MPVWRDVLQQLARWQMLEHDAREAWLSEMRQQRPDIYRRLHHMIQADSDAGAQGSTDEEHAQLQAANLDSKRAGMALGSWTLQQPIGRGGMGHVWLATRADNLYSGRAAVKLLNTLTAGPEADARFAREAQFLGRLAHPHIAQLFDAGMTPDGTRYLIMEYVEGAPLDQACNARQAGIEERLELFLQVCAAVGYAHSQQIIHRDLKPANILVSAEGRVKLLDFGVAKLLDEDVSGAGLTRADCGWFTLEFAAPEQLIHGPVTTATDVYTLGALLFNLLCGGSPHRKRANLNEAIVHYAEPAISLRAGLQRTDAAVIAAQRCTPLNKLERQLRGELNAIVAKCLAVNPAERYDTAHALADDVRRYLRHEPLRARANHWTYRARKFVQRNRLQTSAACMVAASLLLGGVFATWQWRAAVQEAQRTRAAIDMLTGTFGQLTPDRASTPQVAVGDLFRQGWQQVLKKTADDPSLRAMIAQPLGAMLVDVGEVAAGIEALETNRRYLLANGAGNSAEYLAVLAKLANAHFHSGDLEQAKLQYRELLRRTGTVPEHQELTINTHIWLGEIARREGDLPLAKAEATQAVTAAKARFGTRSPVYVDAQEKLTRVKQDLGEWLPNATPRVARTARGVPSDPNELIERMNEAISALTRGEIMSAAADLEVLAPAALQRFGAQDPNTVLAYGWLEGAMGKSGRRSESEAAAQQAYASAQRSPSADLRANMDVMMARHLMSTNRWEQAEPFIRHAQAHFTNNSKMRPFVARTRRLEGEWLLRGGRIPAALETLRRAQQELTELNQGPTPDTAYSCLLQAVATDIGNGAAAALTLYEESNQLATRFLPPGHPDLGKFELLQSYARWRAARSPAAAIQLRASAQSYVDARTRRADIAFIRTLAQKLPGTVEAHAVSDNLLAVLDH
jgi:eukaryotic-like serine/threonine-protein kinase